MNNSTENPIDFEDALLKSERRSNPRMKNALDLIANMYPDTQPYPEDLPESDDVPTDDAPPLRPLPNLEFLQERPVDGDDAIVAPPGAPARRSLKRKFDDQQEAGPSHKRVLTYDDQPEDQKPSQPKL